MAEKIKEISLKGKAIQTDVGSLSEVDNLAEESLKEFGPIDF